ncbi:MAG: rhodanese-like domain-containing protein [Verrucomicrobia bacterium]|nr:rhodanese-like domain-containing protein [Verrucomicrobiota bacterium]
MGDMVPRLTGMFGSGLPSVTADDLCARMGAPDAPVLLDVRGPAEFADGHLEGAVNIPHEGLASRLGDLGPDRGREIVVYCAMGGRAAHAATALRRAGFTDVRLLAGHMRSWCAAGRPVQR